MPVNIFTLQDDDQLYLWEQLTARDLEEVAAKAQASLVKPRTLAVRMLGYDWQIKPDDKCILGPPNGPRADKRTAVCLAGYLNSASDAPLSGRLVPEKNLPGGDRFFAGTHGFKRAPILDRFGYNGQLFLRKAQALGATALAEGPDLYTFWLMLLPKVPVQATLSIGDDEFPPEINFAFDAGTASQCTLGVLAALIGLMTEYMLTN